MVCNQVEASTEALFSKRSDCPLFGGADYLGFKKKQKKQNMHSNKYFQP